MSEFFGEAISTYTEEQAIEDGFKADLGRITLRNRLVRITATKGFISDVNTLQAMHILLKTLSVIHPKKPNWLVFRKAEKEHTEDQGRTLIVPMETSKNIYAILDDHHTHYVLTFLLAEEY